MDEGSKGLCTGMGTPVVPTGTSCRGRLSQWGLFLISLPPPPSFAPVPTTRRRLRAGASSRGRWPPTAGTPERSGCRQPAHRSLPGRGHVWAPLPRPSGRAGDRGVTAVYGSSSPSRCRWRASGHACGRGHPGTGTSPAVPCTLRFLLYLPVWGTERKQENQPLF